MYVAIDKLLPLPWSCYGWWSYDRNDYGDHIFDIKGWRIRINFNFGTHN